MVAVGVQARKRPAATKFSPSAKEVRHGAPKLSHTKSGGFGNNTAAKAGRLRDNRQDAGAAWNAARLFDGIVGSLARDHYIVNVALAQTGATDADEARLL